MSLRFVDSFDHYAAGDVGEKWTATSGITIPTSVGRRGTAGAQLGISSGDLLEKVLDAQATWTIGFAFKSAGQPNSAFDLLRLRDAGTDQLTLRWNTDGTLSVTRAGTVLGTSSFALAVGTFYYIELKATIHNTTGSFEVRVDGINRLSGSNIDTQNTSNASANGIRFVGSSGLAQRYTLDDLYLCDGQGAANNSFLGDCRVDSYLPAADGANTGLTPSSGTTHFSLVDDATPNDDTDYNESATLGAKDTYGFADMAHNPASVFGVQINLNVKKDDAGFRQVKDVVRSAGTDFPGTAQAVSTSYSYKSAMRETDPATSAPWTKAGVNGAEFGMEVA
jgi:hypothetical protein